MKTLLTSTALCLLALLATSCYDPHAHDSAIVREVEANGSGDLSTYTLQGLVQWFSQRPQLAGKIYGECVPRSKTAQANWITTAEGTACRAAQVTAPPPQMTADQRTW